MIKDNCSD